MEAVTRDEYGWVIPVTKNKEGSEEPGKKQ